MLHTTRPRKIQSIAAIAENLDVVIVDGKVGWPTSVYCQWSRQLRQRSSERTTLNSNSQAQEDVKAGSVFPEMLQNVSGEVAVHKIIIDTAES